MLRIKICCIQSVDEAELAIGAGADALGLVGPMPSGPGPIDDATIAEIAAHVSERAMTVLLTSQTEVAAVVDHVARCGTTAVQLVDAVDVGTVPALRARFPELTVIQVIHVRSPEEVDASLLAAQTVDMLLLDSGAPGGAIKELGGTGRVHDWSISAQIVRRSPVPVWLAGGLRPDNAAQAVRSVQPYGLDICSGLRPNGPLDPHLLARFVDAARDT